MQGWVEQMPDKNSKLRRFPFTVTHHDGTFNERTSNCLLMKRISHIFPNFKNIRSIPSIEIFLLRASRNEILLAIPANNAKSKNFNTYVQYIYIYDS